MKIFKLEQSIWSKKIFLNSISRTNFKGIRVKVERQNEDVKMNLKIVRKL